MNLYPLLGHRVEMVYGVTEAVRGRGTVVAYSPGPQVLVEDENGKKEWWLASLTRDVTCSHCGGTGTEP